MVSISLITFVGKDCVQARHALSLFCLWSAAVSLRSPMSIFRTASPSSLYVPLGSQWISSLIGWSKVLYVFPSAKFAVSSASLTFAASLFVQWTCEYIQEPPGPSAFSPRFSAFSIHSFWALTLSAFKQLGWVTRGHCNLNAASRWVYVSFSVFLRLKNHRSALEP